MEEIFIIYFHLYNIASITYFIKYSFFINNINKWFDQCNLFYHHTIVFQILFFVKSLSNLPFCFLESTFVVKLAKGSRGLGLSVTGGIEGGGSWPGLIRIKRLFPHQPASACGLLNVGDLVLEANGVSLTGLTNYVSQIFHKNLYVRGVFFK